MRVLVQMISLPLPEMESHTSAFIVIFFLKTPHSREGTRQSADIIDNSRSFFWFGVLAVAWYVEAFVENFANANFWLEKFMCSNLLWAVNST